VKEDNSTDQEKVHFILDHAPLAPWTAVVSAARRRYTQHSTDRKQYHTWAPSTISQVPCTILNPHGLTDTSLVLDLRLIASFSGVC